jgi:hypothetical protein
MMFDFLTSIIVVILLAPQGSPAYAQQPGYLTL